MDADGKRSTSSAVKTSRKSPASAKSASKPAAKTPDASLNPPAKTSAASASSIKPHGKDVATSAVAARGFVNSAAVTSKRRGKSVLPASGDDAVLFRDVKLGPQEATLRFRLIHHWEARRARTNTLIGLEMLFIDEEGNVIQGFIPSGKAETYRKQLVAGSVYQLTNFFGSKNKDNYRVTDHLATVSFSWNTSLTVLENSPVNFPEDHFRFHGHEEFIANCDKKGDLYDFLGHMKLINGNAMDDDHKLDDGTNPVLLHVQTEDGPVMKLSLWDHAARAFCSRFNAHDGTPRVVLVTTLNPKQYKGTLMLGSMSSSRVFMDNDVEPTRKYTKWLDANEEIANRINAEIVTKPEITTIGGLFSYVKREGATVALFECTAVVDDVLQGSSWYYVACGDCNTKATKGVNSLTCENPKCENVEIAGKPQYLTRLSVYDESRQAVFVVLGDAGCELTGKHAAELVATYFEANEDIGADQPVPVPQALLDCIGQTYKFIVKVTERNFTGQTQSITVTRVLPADPPEMVADVEQLEDVQSPASLDDGGSANDRIRKNSGGSAGEEAKRAKCG